ncbi:MAG: 30S ribosomal protein S8 [Candidatus Marinimicrobia bacterium]|jgi:small subunit ribosomal protein S8|nr:30S ribosomal protein S8 [Candidatus Neomarinimicrobiota bacterium]MBT3728056.1 30S ribosomal protein S8 [Candidatus Neomarinimicrobiota bacterium]MBT3944270.1 30S ribosomal protein S8 [Candidatus Neomarinimicrobiota bacterium]MBT4111655.1 30S ribosomal protein S8 [Candidatus Neomarinimicrobiota bacterium]MBT4316622.1 30S ribosomal protein S8 [Candidatus Neomarinimicrobiota bacterium]|tara:strand:- start:438 stop:836 length:399 start_codon:yes stop_codon:yes gene_type:complete
MSMTDPIADFCTRIRNGYSSQKRWVDVPSSLLKKRIAVVLKEEGYIDNVVFVSKEDKKEDIRVFLRYHNESPAITTIEKISKPGKRVYVASDEIPRVLNGLGISVISSSKGVISNKVARELKVGGELLCNVW